MNHGVEDMNLDDDKSMYPLSFLSDTIKIECVFLFRLRSDEIESEKEIAFLWGNEY